MMICGNLTKHIGRQKKVSLTRFFDEMNDRKYNEGGVKKVG